MKSATRFVYFLIFIFSAIYVFKHEKYSKRIQIINGYTENFSVNKGEPVVFYLNSQVAHKQGVVCIYDVHGTIVDSLTLDLIVQQPQTDTLLYENGYKYINPYSYNTSKLRSGLYLIGNVVPFIVKEPNLKNAVTVVFPYANFMALSNEGGRSFDPENSRNKIPARRLSLKRLPYFRNQPFTFLSWIDSTMKYSNVNFISDLDIETYNNIAQTKLLILYGYQGFWTIDQRKCFDKYLDEGGQTLAICSNLINNKMIFDKKNKQLQFMLDDMRFNPENKARRAVTWNQFYSNTLSVGCSYELACSPSIIKTSLGGYKIIEANHPVFEGINSGIIEFDSKNGNGIAVNDCNFRDFPIPQNNQLNFFKNVILAYDYSELSGFQQITGIFNFKKTRHSGEIIVVGNEKWSYGDIIVNSQIGRVTANCIDYLLTSSN